MIGKITRVKVKQHIYLVQAKRVPPKAGNKAYNLHLLMKAGVRVPTTLVIPWDAYEQYLQGDLLLIENLQEQLSSTLNENRSYAVRSSASLEDGHEHSFAGQFKTMLDVKGVSAVLQAVWSIWATASSPAVHSYLKALSDQEQNLQMGVIVQEMVRPVLSGVAFSRNPVSGEHEIIVEAVEGPGTALVQRGVTPYRWVNRQGDTTSGPEDVPGGREIIEQVIAQTRKLAAWFKKDLDLEWVFDGQELNFVQMREITSLKNKSTYSNKIAREVLPGMIKPLVWSVNVPLVNSAWIRLLTELVGPNDLMIDDLARSFYYRSYFNITALGRIWKILGMPQESLEIMMGVIPKAEGQRFFKPTWRMISLVPRLCILVWNKWQLGLHFERDYPRLKQVFDAYDWKDASQKSEVELLEVIDSLFADLKGVTYYNINIPMLMAVYTALFNRQLKNVGVDPSDFALIEGMKEFEDIDLDWTLKALREEYKNLGTEVQANLRQISLTDFLGTSQAPDFQLAVQEFLQRFGHLSDSGNDFSSVPWREKPEIVFDLIAHETAISKTEQKKVYFTELKIPGWKKAMVKSSFDRARQFRLYREQVSLLYTFSYGLFRPYFVALGCHFVQRRVLSEPEDIFYLTWVEVETIVIARPDGGNEDYAELVGHRKSDMQRCRDIQLPAIIYGEAAPILDSSMQEKLTGVPTSPGVYSGTVKTVTGLSDAGKVEPGDVLVIPYSDVSWTPLIARSGAVIAESGGILSHSSIVAREYQIPAVVSVSGAMQLTDHTRVTVDGFRGEVILHKEEK